MEIDLFKVMDAISGINTLAKRRGTQIRFGSRVSTIHGDRGIVSRLEPNGVLVWIYNSDFPYVIGKYRYYTYREVTTLPDWTIDYRPNAHPDWTTDYRSDAQSR